MNANLNGISFVKDKLKKKIENKSCFCVVFSVVFCCSCVVFSVVFVLFFVVFVLFLCYFLLFFVLFLYCFLLWFFFLMLFQACRGVVGGGCVCAGAA